jgi:hypothetical protein
MLKMILVICAIVCFCLDAFRVAARISWTPLGFAFVTAAVLLPL